MSGPEHRWHSFGDRNRALAVADYARHGAQRRAAGAEVTADL